MANKLEQCPGCLALFPCNDKPLTHPYIGASPACWALYGGILAREYNNPAYFEVHRLTVDSYAACHIGDQSDRRARQSANIHLIALYLALERKLDLPAINDFLQRAASSKRDWPGVEQLQNPRWMTILDVHRAVCVEEHQHLVRQWARSVLDEYREYWPVLFDVLPN